MEEPRLHLQITDERSLLDATDYLHDGVFPPKDAQYDAAEGVFTLTMWREVAGRRVPTRIPLVSRRVDHWARCRLVLRQVKHAIIRPKRRGDTMDSLPWPMVNEVVYRPETSEIRVLDCAGDLEITLQVSAIDGYLDDTGEITSDPDRWQPDPAEGDVAG